MTVRRLLGAILAAPVGLLAAPGIATAHQITGRYESPLPLAAYLGGAAFAVALSFAFVLSRPSAPAAPSAERSGPGRILRLPRSVRAGLRAVGLVAWAWIVAQLLAGGSSEGDVASLFLWVYGWVGIALVSALLFPIWHWLDPFLTIHDLLAVLLRRLGVGGWRPSPYPAALGRWPAVAGFAVIVWLELAVPAARGGRVLALALLAYTLVTLLGMAQFGRDAWREHSETFSVWLATLGRLAPLGVVEGAPDGTLIRRRPASGLAGAAWTTDRLVLVALAVGSVIFDGFSQTDVFFGWFGAPEPAATTALLAGFLGGLAVVVLAASRVVGVAAMGAGLVPIAVGYLVAHYLTFLLVDGQRIVLAATDPLGLGADLLGIGEFEPSGAWIAPWLAWGIQLGAVVAGHVVGAWAGHAAAVRAVAGTPAALAAAQVRLRQVPLAVLMVVLTTLTLWSLGQNIVRERGASETGAAPATPIDAN